MNPSLPKVWEEGIKKSRLETRTVSREPTIRANENSGTVASAQGKTTGYPGIFKFVI